MYHDRNATESQCTPAPVSLAGRAPRVADLLVERRSPAEANTDVTHLVSGSDLLTLAEVAQDAVDRLGLGGNGTWAALEAMTRLGIEVLRILTEIPPRSRGEVRRRGAIYARQRCDAAFADFLARSLENDCELYGINPRDLH